MRKGKECILAKNIQNKYKFIDTIILFKKHKSCVIRIVTTKVMDIEKGVLQMVVMK